MGAFLGQILENVSCKFDDGASTAISSEPLHKRPASKIYKLKLDALDSEARAAQQRMQEQMMGGGSQEEAEEQPPNQLLCQTQ